MANSHNQTATAVFGLPTHRAAIRTCGLVAGVMLCIGIGAVYAASARFESAGTYLKDGTYYLDSFARLELGDAAEAALANGVNLYFLVEVTVHRKRRWWIDTPVLERRLRYKLYYYDLTLHYRVEDLQTGDSTNFRSLAAALRELGKLDKFALIPQSRLSNGRRYSASIRLALDHTRLPGPLQAQALVSRDWQLESEEFSWLLN
jgi:hypothetical protein